LHRNGVHQAIWEKRPEKPSKKIIMLHENTRPLMENLMEATLAAVGWEVMNHPGLAPGNFYLDQ
jgi:hypothetical protein